MPTTDFSTWLRDLEMFPNSCIFNANQESRGLQVPPPPSPLLPMGTLELGMRHKSVFWGVEGYLIGSDKKESAYSIKST